MGDGIKVIAVDEVTGEMMRCDLRPGRYVVVAANPCRVARESKLGETVRELQIAGVYGPAPQPHPADAKDVHTWFGLTYSNYLVLHRTLLQSMPKAWQHQFTELLDELRDAFAHVDQAQGYQVLPERECTYSDLTAEDMTRFGITCSDDDPEFPDDKATVYWDAAGDEHEPDDTLSLPVGDDPVPHYNRGRTRIEPRPGDDRG